MFKRATYLPALFIGSFLLKPKFIFNSPKEEPKKVLINQTNPIGKSGFRIDIFGYTIYEKYKLKDYINIIDKINQKYFYSYFEQEEFWINMQILNSKDFPIELINLFVYYNINTTEFKGNIDNLSSKFKLFILNKLKIEFIEIEDSITYEPFMFYKEYGLKVSNKITDKDKTIINRFNNDEKQFLELIINISKHDYYYSFFMCVDIYNKFIAKFEPFKFRFYLPLKQIGKLEFTCRESINNKMDNPIY
jgi:hypothetical protein